MSSVYIFTRYARGRAEIALNWHYPDQMALVTSALH